MLSRKKIQRHFWKGLQGIDPWLWHHGWVMNGLLLSIYREIERESTHQTDVKKDEK